MTAQEQLKSVLGAKNVIDKRSVLDQYAGDMSFVSSIKPDCIVKPGNREDVEKIVKIAGKRRLPWSPLAPGRPTSAAILSRVSGGPSWSI